MTLTESETIDCPREREEKTRNTDSHNSINLNKKGQ